MRIGGSCPKDWWVTQSPMPGQRRVSLINDIHRGVYVCVLCV